MYGFSGHLFAQIRMMCLHDVSDMGCCAIVLQYTFLLPSCQLLE